MIFDNLFIYHFYFNEFSKIKFWKQSKKVMTRKETKSLVSIVIIKDDVKD